METITTSQGRRLIMRSEAGQGPRVVFLGGFRSDMTGTKAAWLSDWARDTGRAFVRFDYSGHGESEGDFEEGTIGRWVEDAEAVLDLSPGPAVLVGSSMGGWISLLIARKAPERLAGLVTIAAAPDFTEDSMWAEASDTLRQRLMTEGRIEQPSEYGAPYPITRRLIEDGRANLVLRTRLHLPMPVRMLQGTADPDVPQATAIRLLDHATGPDIRLTLVKDADHRFSSPRCLRLIARAIEEVSWTLPPLDGLEAWLEAREAQVPDLRPGCEKKVLWANGPRRSPWSVIYVHGFSASRREVSPFAERVAEGLDANLFATRLTGHGQDGDAMAMATLRGWRTDVAEALAIGRALGDRVLAVSCSTGCTLITLSLAEGERVAGTVMISPNFGLRLRRLQVALDAPFAARWAPLLIRRPQRPPAASVLSDIWTSGYPVQAYAPMAEAVRAVRRADLEAITAPALFVHSEDDQIVEPQLTVAVMRRWGAPACRISPVAGEKDDPMAHVIAGDALSPGQTGALVQATLAWARDL